MNTINFSSVSSRTAYSGLSLPMAVSPDPAIRHVVHTKDRAVIYDHSAGFNHLGTPCIGTISPLSCAWAGSALAPGSYTMCIQSYS
ncbi:hypothetical protein J2S01_000682 [Pectinatus haikarae]|uniref:Uncharacterized protein n=1 Tax=Pectinatus haikarae TaxID=349096 RepID=A0ABT9Y576_9FIRM|nr:hypothetical protein [Pectinatus haikarae]